MMVEMVDTRDFSTERWSRTKLTAFRFAFVITALSSLYLCIVIPTYLFFDTLKRPVQTVVIAVANAHLRITMSVGAFIISRASGDYSPMRDLVESYTQWLTAMASPANVGRATSAHFLALVVLGTLVTIIWSHVDRRRVNYERLYRWMRVWARYMLALAMMVFAVTKVVPTQFGYLMPGEMLRPIGQLSAWSLLWDFMAASTLYTVFAGLTELVGVFLLFFRRTTVAGALLLGAAMTNVVVMDVGYRVGGGGQAIAILLLALDLIVLIPYVRPLASFLFLGRPAALPPEPGFLSRPWRYSAVVSFVAFAVLFSVRAQDGLARRRAYFGAAHPLFGLFDVERFERNGTPVTPLASDGTTWKRVGNIRPIFFGDGLAVQFANADVRQYRLMDDAANHVWTLRQGSTDFATLRYAVASDGAVSLDGQIGQDAIKMYLRRVDPRQFPLLRQ
jgi:hypothetical protein